MRSLAPKTDFLNLDTVVHLAAGGQTPCLRDQLTAVERFVRAKGTGGPGRALNTETRQRAAERAAALLGCEPDDVGFPSSVAQGVSLLVESLDWRAGDNVVMEAWEFPSLLYPWLGLRERGVEVRLLRPEGWQAPLDRVRQAVSERTRVLAISHVSYLTGERHDLAAYAGLARQAGALLVVDASHALGAVPVQAPHADFLFSCCYKWVLGVQGVAIAFWNRARQPGWRPRQVGWHSVEPQEEPLARGGGFTAASTGLAFEPGNPTFVGLYLLEQALAYLARFEPVAIERHVLALSGELRSRLAALGLPLMTPAEPERRAGNICFASERAHEVRRALEAEGVLVSGEDGRVRISTHLYNDLDDVRRGVEALARALKL
jgi:selenocysteine lyase/cysteine desulfurase